jgi:hypothetical protein
MIVTSRIETYYKIEMTAEQAHDLLKFLETLQPRHIKEVKKMAGPSYESKFIDVLEDIKEALRNREETQRFKYETPSKQLAAYDHEGK